MPQNRSAIRPFYDRHFEFPSSPTRLTSQYRKQNTQNHHYPFHVYEVGLRTLLKNFSPYEIGGNSIFLGR
jgi:hypothetical protein